MGKIVSYTLDTLPKLTEEDIARLRKLADLPDSEIDLSDSPEMTEEQWRNAKRFHLHALAKTELTARLDANVVAWLKSTGEDYEARMNTILRRAMRAEMIAKKAADAGAAVDCVGAETNG